MQMATTHAHHGARRGGVSGSLEPRRARTALASLAMFLTAVALAQTTGDKPQSAPTPPVHSAVTPMPRDGWAHERFLAINETLKNMQRVEVLCFGDSITQAWETEGADAWQAHFSGRFAVNLGIGGDRTQHLLWRLENTPLKGLRPSLAIVMIGTNNSNDNSVAEIADGISAIVRSLRAKLPRTKVLLLGILPRGQQPNEERGKLLQVNQIIAKLHDNVNIHYLDVGHVFINTDGSISPDIMPDALHLSPRGYELWAKAMEPSLQHLVP